MREILFRGKDKDGNWHEGDLRQFDHFNGKRFIRINAIYEQGLSAETFEVIPETVC